jgi:ABC-type transport system involved in multi-copper enzyme maturation permease subunit
LRRTLWLGWIAEQPVAIASWFIGIAAFTAMEAALVPQAMHLLDSNANLTKFMAQHGGILTSDQYVGFLMTFTGVFAAAFTVSQVARWVGDAVDHRNDVLLTQPVSMARLLVERAVALVWVSAFIGLAVVMGTLTGAAIGGFSVHLDGVARTFGDIVLLCFAVGGVGTLAATVFRSAAATAVIAGILVASFFLTTIVSLFSWPAWASRPSVFDAFGSPYTSMPGTGSLIYLAGLGVIGTAAAYLAMRRGLRVVA